MKISIASDHRGFQLKSRIVEQLQSAGFEVLDRGPTDSQPVDYPDFASRVGEDVGTAESHRGILICGSGIGMSITANKFPGIRAALCVNSQMAELARRHNDANVLCLGADLVDAEKNLEIVNTFFSTSFEGDRHARRVAKIGQLEAQACHRERNPGTSS